MTFNIVDFSFISEIGNIFIQLERVFPTKMYNFAEKLARHMMQQEEITLQTLTDNEDIQVGYSDNDIVIIDSIQKFAEISNAHVAMNAVAICTQGKVHGIMNGQMIELHKNQVAIIPQNVTITDLMISPDFDLKAMFFTNRILQSFLREKMHIWNDVVYIRRLHVVTLKDDDMLFYTNFYDMLSLCFDKGVDHPFRTDVIQSLLRAVVLGLCGALKQRVLVDEVSADMGVANNHFQRFLDLLHSVDVKHRRVEWYATELCVSPKYLSALCKKHSGKTANEWITEHVLEDIRYYLKQTDYSIKQICDLLGFPNTSFFSKYVKAHFCMTPIEFRTK
jgi:AraC-like DNA-binding protein